MLLFFSLLFRHTSFLFSLSALDDFSHPRILRWSFQMENDKLCLIIYQKHLWMKRVCFIKFSKSRKHDSMTPLRVVGPLRITAAIRTGVCLPDEDLLIWIFLLDELPPLGKRALWEKRWIPKAICEKESVKNSVEIQTRITDFSSRSVIRKYPG